MSVRFLSGVNIDSNTLFVDDANNRVGIGTGSPVSSLNINNGDAWINVTDTLRGLQFGYAGPSHGSYRAAVMGGAESYGGTDSGMLTFHTQNGYVVSAIPPERMRITSAGNVGIGTTSPSEKLVVNGNIGLGTDPFIKWTSNTLTFIPFGDYIPVVKIGGTTTYSPRLEIWNAGDASNVIRFNAGGNSYINTGNVGIGTTTPVYKFEVSDGTRTGVFNPNAALDGFFIGTYQAKPLILGTADTERMRITSAGNVGIGTTAPASRLHIETSASNPFRMVRTGSPATNFGYEFGSGDIGLYDYTNSTYRYYITSTGNVGIGTTSPSYKLQVNGEGNGLYVIGANSAPYTQTIAKFVYGGNNNSINIENQAGKASFQARDNSDAAMSLLLNPVAGSVLIGTGTDAGYKLDVNGTGRFIGSITSNASGVGTLLLGSTSGSSQIAGRITATESPSYSATGKIGFSVTTWGVGTDYGLTEVMAIDMRGSDSKAPTIWMNPFGGNVGIGTTSPASIGTGITSLDIQGSNAGGIAFGPSGTKNYIYGASTMYVEAHTTAVFSTSGSEKMRITSAGNVGIGTTSPAYKLQVDGSTGVRNGSFYIGDESGSTNSAVEFYKSGTTIRMYTNTGAFGGTYGATSASLTLYSGSAYSTLINGNGASYFNAGNVGIGTTSPATKLHVVGYSRNDGGLLLNGSDADYREIIFTTSAASRWNLYAYGGEGGSNAGSVLYLARYADNGDYIANVATFLRTNGYVGIATTTPTQQLHVSGNVRVTGAYYDSNNSAGSSGQVLSSTGSGTAWVNQGEATATSLYDLLPAARTTYAWSVQLTAGTWADIFSSNTVLSNGTWMVQVYVDDYAVGGQQYQETYSGVMSWGSANTTNQGGAEAISEVVLHRSGHAANAGNFYLRTVERVTSTLLLQGMSNQTYSAASTINFKFVKIF